MHKSKPYVDAEYGIRRIHRSFVWRLRSSAMSLDEKIFIFWDQSEKTFSKLLDIFIAHLCFRQSLARKKSACNFWSFIVDSAVLDEGGNNWMSDFRFHQSECRKIEGSETAGEWLLRCLLCQYSVGIVKIDLISQNKTVQNLRYPHL